MKKKVEASVKNLQQLRKDSKKSRKEFLTQKEYVAMLYQNVNKEQIIRRIIKDEEVCHDFQRILWHLDRITGR